MARKDRCTWMYLFCPEDSCTQLGKFPVQPIPTRLLQACKVLLWLGMSILMGVGVSQLG